MKSRIRTMGRVAALAGLLGLAAVMGGAEEVKVNAYFANVPELALKSTEPLAVVSVVQPRLFAPSTGARGHSYYIFGIGQLTEIRMDTGEAVRHDIPFDRPPGDIYDAGANAAWLGPDLKIYFGLQGKPARIGRFDPAANKMELLGALSGHTTLRYQWGPNNKCYVITFPSMLGEIDAATGKIRDLGRLAADAQYVYGDLWVGKDGYFYCTAGIRPPRKVGVNLATGEKKLLDEFPKVEKEPMPTADFPDCGKLYDVNVQAAHDRATVVFGPKDEKERKTATFTCSTMSPALHTIAVGPDGKIYGCGSYNNFVFDPATGKAQRQDFVYNIYNYEAAGAKLYFGGYPNARLGYLDTARPLNIGPQREIWANTAPDRNPREVLQIWTMKDTSDPAGKLLKQKRLWSIARAADGKLYLGCSATRQERGGALVIFDPETEKPISSLREPFRFLGIPSLCPIDGGKQLGIVTWVSPDYTAPGKEPDAGRLFIYDVAAARIVHESTPLPGCKILRALCQAPGTRMLVGMGLRGVEPTEEADDAFYGNGELFFFDLDQMKTVKRLPFDFEISRREGRPIAPAPDGSLWMSGAGGILRVDAMRLSVEPLARCATSGNMVFIGNTLYIVGGPTLRYGDVSALLKKRWERGNSPEGSA